MAGKFPDLPPFHFKLAKNDSGITEVHKCISEG